MTKTEIIELINRLEVMLNKKIPDTSLFHIALTHRSYANEKNIPLLESNERLEFLGDAVLGLLIGELLMKKFPQSQEGELSKLRSLVVNEKSLASLARVIDLGKFLYLGKGEISTQGREKDSILADAYEAIIAAIYLATGLEETRTFVTTSFSQVLDQAHQESKDYKTLLQEYAQKKLKQSPSYLLINSLGPDHEKVFETEVRVLNAIRGRGTGRSKKESEQNAAKEALLQLQAENEQL